MSDSPETPARWPVRLTVAAIVVLHASIAACGLLAGPPASDELSQIWPGYLAMCVLSSFRVLLAVWMVFGGGHWLLRWPLTLAAVSAVAVVSLSPYLPPNSDFSVYVEPLLSALLPVLAAGVVGAVVLRYGWQATVAPEPAPLWRSSVRETLATMLALALLLIAVRWHAANEEQITAWARGIAPAIQPPPALETASELLSHAVEAAVSVLWMATLVAATVFGRPRMGRLAAALAASYGVGVLGGLIIEVKLTWVGASGDLTLVSGVCGAIAGAFVLASLLALRLVHWRIERTPRPTDAIALDAVASDAPTTDEVAP